MHTGLNVEAVGAIEGYASAARGAFPAARDSRDADPLSGPKGAAFGSIFDNPGRLVARVRARFRMEFATTDGADLDADERFGWPARRPGISTKEAASGGLNDSARIWFTSSSIR